MTSLGFCEACLEPIEPDDGCACGFQDDDHLFHAGCCPREAELYWQAEYIRWDEHWNWCRVLPTLTVIDVYRAAPHRWGLGKTHHVDYGRDRTLCGKLFDRTPGIYERDRGHDHVTCKSCIKCATADERQEARRAEAFEQQAQWWARYAAYLASPEWQAKRLEVFARCAQVCERCGSRRAVQVHHLTYDRLGDERLDDLLAVCMPCHRALHPDKNLGATRRMPA